MTLYTILILAITMLKVHCSAPEIDLGDQKLVSELQDVQLIQELEKLIANLDSEQLDKLEEILVKDADGEFSPLLNELKEMGMEESDIDDLKELSTMMHHFLLSIPDVSKMLNLQGDPYSLKDHIKLYLLGLPNKLGPLGFVALHSALFDDEIVDVKVGEFVPSGKTSYEHSDDGHGHSGHSEGGHGHNDREAKQKVPATTVGEILARRRRSLGF